MKFQQRMLGVSAGLLMFGCALTPTLSVSQTADDNRLIGQWACQLLPTASSTQAVATWTEVLAANGELVGRGALSSLIGEAVITSRFTGRGQWSAQQGLYRNTPESIDLKMEGDPTVIALLNQSEIRSGFLQPSVESYTLDADAWVRRKSGEEGVTICHRES